MKNEKAKIIWLVIFDFLIIISMIIVNIVFQKTTLKIILHLRLLEGLIYLLPYI